MRPTPPRPFSIAAGLTLAIMATARIAAPDASAMDLAAADRTSEGVQDELVDELRAMATSRAALIAIAAQNKRLAGLDQARIDSLDAQWRAETESENQPLIAQLMGSPLSSYLIRKKAESNGLYAEIFVFDANGMNVGQSSVTSDYWQGDEPKYLETFAKGPGAVFIDAVEYHQDTRQRRRQVSFTIVDPDSGQPVGGATVEINVDELERRS